MTTRLIPMVGLLSLMAGLASAEDKPEAKKPTTARTPQVQAALDAARKDLPRAIVILDDALKTTPDDRDSLYLLGAMSFVQGDLTEDRSGRIASFRQSASAFARLQDAFKDLKPHERAFLGRSRIGEARILALEGKDDEAVAKIKQAMAEGFVDLDALGETKDLEAVRERPAFKIAIEESMLPAVLKEMAAFKPFPFDFELKDTDDQLVRLADFRGKVTIVDIWGTWCPPCRAEIPHFVELLHQYREQRLEIVGINSNEQGSPDEIKRKIKEFARAFEMPYRCVLNDGTTEAKVPMFGGYPTTLFLDRSGKVRMMQFGYVPKARLELIVKTLLAERSNPEAR